jgi:hypothetical protein
VSRPLE